MIELIEKKIHLLKTGCEISEKQKLIGERIFNEGECFTIAQIGYTSELYISSSFYESLVSIHIGEEDISAVIGNNTEWNEYSFAALLQYQADFLLSTSRKILPHKKYTREGMIKRVLEERSSKATNAEYRIQWGSSIYGDHLLTNEKGVKYTIFLRDFENETGYSSSADSQYNKLGTTKHIMYAFTKLKESQALHKKLDDKFPYVEIFLDPLNEYKISWYYPNTLPDGIQSLITKWFRSKTYIENLEITQFFGFLRESEKFREIKIRPEVLDKIDRFYENLMLERVEAEQTIDFGPINATLYPYQKEGICFASFKKNSIIADEMGLGKTIQAISTAIAKEQLFSFTKTLIVCPASLKNQWKTEIEKFTDKTAQIVGGLPEERITQYKSDAFFLIVNYEAVMRDQIPLAEANIDFLILDEAQRAKNFETKTFSAVRNVKSRHTLIITGTPIENKLLDIYSLCQILDPGFLGPLWEFSYKHCLFDPEKKQKINGYFDLQELKEQLAPILIRREKRKVLEQLPDLNQLDIPVVLHPEQASYHSGYSTSISRILSKKFITPVDLTRINMLLTKMRMVCNSTFLVDEGKTNYSPKLDELKYILTEKFDLINNNRKIIIFSEWIKTHKLIGDMLRKEGIGFTELNGSIPVKKRGVLIDHFENNPACKIFLSTEAGGTGLNLQMADTVINFELPWNPAKKNQRIGRIDRIGQTSKKLTVINFISEQSIETRIASGLVLKENLFEGVLNSGSSIDSVDFSVKGRSQFLKDIEEMVRGIDAPLLSVEDKYAELDNEVTEDEIVIVDPLDEIISQPSQSVTDSEVDQNKTTNTDTVISEEKNSLSKHNQAEQMEDVLTQGLGFLSGLMSMATGGSSSLESAKVEVDKLTGEVIMRFKLPGF